jgi:hypothetical protein
MGQSAGGFLAAHIGLNSHKWLGEHSHRIKGAFLLCELFHSFVDPPLFPHSIEKG